MHRAETCATRRVVTQAGARLAALAWLPALAALAAAGCFAHFPSAERSMPVGFSEFPGEFLVPGEIQNQSSDLPELVTILLRPTLGCPARIEPGGRLVVYLDRKPKPSWRYFLVDRAKTPFLEQTDFVLEVPGPEEARALVEARDRYSTLRSSTQGCPSADESPFTVSSPSSEADEGVSHLLGAHDVPDLPESQRRLRAIVDGFRAKTAAVVAAGGAGAPLAVVSTDRATELLAGDPVPPPPESPVHRVVLEAGPAREGLFALAVWDDSQERLVDVQFNAVYARADDRDPLDFLVAADLQWGMDVRVVRNCLQFVQSVNLRCAAGPGTRPEFVILVGDLVDCNFGSRATDISIFNYTYTKEYIQSWLVLVGLRVPCYVVPGNHDGYRFRNDLGGTQEDGLFCFRSTFGLPYYAFDRGGYRFFCLNSYDLPSLYRTARIKPFNLELHEWVVPRFNILNWGGAIGPNQFRWLTSVLGGPGRDDAPARPLWFLHNEPRGTYPALKKRDQHLYDSDRHVPLSMGPTERNRVEFAPRWSQTEEVHAGHYSPIRLFNTSIRARDWFEAVMPPPFCGYPGWIRYQQGWHVPYSYEGDFDSPEPFAPLRHPFPDPLDVLELMLSSGVRAVFKGHDNHFCRNAIGPGETLLPRELLAHGGKKRRDRIRRLVVPGPRSFVTYHVADLADLDSDGHGYYAVRIEDDEITVRILDLF